MPDTNRLTPFQAQDGALDEIIRELEEMKKVQTVGRDRLTTSIGLLTETIRRLRAQRTATKNAEKLGLPAEVRVLLQEGAVRMGGLARALPRRNPEARVTTPPRRQPAAAPKVRRTVKNSPLITAMASSLLRALFGEGHVPQEKSLEDALKRIHKSTISPALALGHLGKALGYLNNHVYESTLDQQPPYIAALYRDLGFPSRWEEIRQVFNDWNEAADNAKNAQKRSA